MEWAAREGLASREDEPIQEPGIDERSLQKRPEYFTVLVDRNAIA
jgi:hypothetical protein